MKETKIKKWKIGGCEKKSTTFNSLDGQMLININDYTAWTLLRAKKGDKMQTKSISFSQSQAQKKCHKTKHEINHNKRKEKEKKRVLQEFYFTAWNLEGLLKI